MFVNVLLKKLSNLFSHPILVVGSVLMQLGGVGSVCTETVV